MRPNGLVGTTTIRLTTSNRSATTATRFRWRSRFGLDDIAVTAEQNVLTIEGQKAEQEQRDGVTLAE